MELDVQNITGEHQQLLTPFMIKAGAEPLQLFI